MELSAYNEVESYKIPDKIIALIERINEVFSLNIEIDEAPIALRNRGGFVYAYGKGFRYTYCTSSMVDGAEYDYSKEIKSILCHCGFSLENSFGDNGMDSSTNWHDTYWNYEFVYKDSLRYVY